MQTKTSTKILGALTLLLVSTMVHAQNVGTGIDAAANEVKGVFGNVSNLVIIIGGVVGLVGALRAFIKWQNGDQDVQKHVVGWMGACVFLLLSGVALKTMFGI